MARFLLVFGCCSLALAQTAQPPSQPLAQAVDWRFAQPDAELRMSLNLQAVLNSPTVAMAIEQAKAQAKDNAMQVDLALGMMKMIDRVSLSIRQKTTPATGTKAAASASPDVEILALLTGSFDPQLIGGLLASAGAGAAAENAKVVGPHALLLGEGDSLKKAAARMAGPAAASSGAELEQSDFWISTSSKFLDGQSGGLSAQVPGIQKLRGIEMGMNIGDSPEFNVVLSATDPAGAGEILKAIQDGISQYTKSTPTAVMFTKALNLDQAGSKVRMHLVVPAEVVAMAQQQMASGGLQSQLAPMLGGFGIGGAKPAAFGGQSTPGRQPTPTVIHELPPQNGGKVVIYGLDGGPKEVPVQK